MSAGERKITHDPRLDVYGREETHDFKSAAEVRSLVRNLDVRADDVVLEIGTHIGAFARLCLKRGARVIGVEPEPSNRELALRNTADWSDRFTLLAGAATDSPDLLARDTIRLHLRGVTHTGLHTIFAPKQPKGHVDVPVFAFRELVESYRPTVIKVDIEGGEWLLDFADLPAHVRAMHVEMHMIPAAAGGRERAPVVHRLILDQGFTAIKKPNFNVMWGTHPIYVR